VLRPYDPTEDVEDAEFEDSIPPFAGAVLLRGVVDVAPS